MGLSSGARRRLPRLHSVSPREGLMTVVKITDVIFSLHHPYSSGCFVEIVVVVL